MLEKIFFIIFMPFIAAFYVIVCGLIYLLSLLFGFNFTWKLGGIVYLALLGFIAFLVKCIKHRKEET